MFFLNLSWRTSKIKIIPSPVFASIFGIEIYWYGVLITLGILSCIFFASKIFKERNLKEDDLYDISMLTIIFGIIGARIYHVLSTIDYYVIYPKEIFNFRAGGLGIYGAIAGGFLGVFLGSRIKKISLQELINIGAIVIPFGQSIGRWGNFFNQELFGKPTNFFLKIYIEEEKRPYWHVDSEYFHPLFLYESLACFLIFLLLFLSRKKNFNKSASLYLILYGFWRFFAEFLRDTQTPTFIFRLEQWVSLLSIFIGLYSFAFKFNKNERKREKST